jgi:hypothetical protein
MPVCIGYPSQPVFVFHDFIAIQDDEPHSFKVRIMAGNIAGISSARLI